MCVVACDICMFFHIEYLLHCWSFEINNSLGLLHALKPQSEFIEMIKQYWRSYWLRTILYLAYRLLDFSLDVCLLQFREVQIQTSSNKTHPMQNADWNATPKYWTYALTPFIWEILLIYHSLVLDKNVNFTLKSIFMDDSLEIERRTGRRFIAKKSSKNIDFNGGIPTFF